MAVSEKPWGDIPASAYADAGDYCAASLVDLNPANEAKTKDRCYLPVREPRAMGGNLNRNGVFAAAAVLAGSRGGVDIPADEKRAAARTLVGYYRRELKTDPPASLLNIAGMG